jgi:guanylate kinase
MSLEDLSGLAIVVAGPSGSGKTTLVKHLMHHYPDSHFSISATTRPRRGEEVDGVDYRFMGREEFRLMRDEKGLLEWAEVHGEYYGTPCDEVRPSLDEGHAVFLDIDVQGALSVKEILKERAYLLFVLPPSMEVLEQRLRGRGTDSTEVIQLRLKNALGEIAALPQFGSVVINDDISRTVTEASTLLEKGERNLTAWLEADGREWLKSNFNLDL